MKTLVVGTTAIIALVSTIVQAQPYQRPGAPSLNGNHYHYHTQPRYYHRHRDWVEPVINGIGTVIIVEQIHRRNHPDRIIIEEVITPAPKCSSWREFQFNDGTIYRERICP
jgi:hypothetical protein